jgi:uncharacterized secreted protein with C-terminal beta-propeller domain
MPEAEISFGQKKKNKMTLINSLCRKEGHTKMAKLLLVISCFCIMALFSSCQNDSAWYPSASVTVNSTAEFTDSITSSKGLHITLVIHNTGKTSIINSIVTVQAKTSARVYLQTAASDIKINPGGKVAVSLSLSYLDNTEILQSDGVTVYNSFFE